jgi:hypothetical protein
MTAEASISLGPSPAAMTGSLAEYACSSRPPPPTTSSKRSSPSAPAPSPPPPR